jgi:hypothetical protein
MRNQFRALPLLGLILVSDALGQIPQTISYQGVLTDTSGTPVPDGSVELTVRLFDVPDDGTVLWQETQQVPVRRGVFSVILGSVAPVNLPFDRPYWLGITVGQGAELAPRVALTASPYSLNSRLTMAQPENGQGITVRNQTGEATHVMHQDGEVFHKGRATLAGGADVSTPDTSLSVAGDTAMVIGSPRGPAIAFIVNVLPASPANGTASKNGTVLTGGRQPTLNRPAGRLKPADIIGGNLTVFGGEIGVVDGSTHDDASTIGVNGIWTRGTIEAAGGISTSGEIGARSLHIVGAAGDTLSSFNADGTSEHSGLETFKAGLQTVLTNGNILRFSPAEGLTLKTPAGQFRGHIDPNGNALFAGNVSKGGGSFKIDHPLDPENKYLYHSFVESPDMMNVYNGNVVLDAGGEAVVDLPEWFEALNRDFRYQLTAIGRPGPDLHVADEISGNRFRIAGGKGGTKVSWQVMGIRKDAFANKHRIPVEEQKPVAERGRYLHPESFGLPPEMGVSVTPLSVDRRPFLMR